MVPVAVIFRKNILRPEIKTVNVAMPEIHGTLVGLQARVMLVPGRNRIPDWKAPGDDHALRPVADRVVDRLGVGAQQCLGLVATRLELGAKARVAHDGEDHLVELHIAAAEIGEFLDLLAIGPGKVGPELVDVAVGARVERRCTIGVPRE